MMICENMHEETLKTCNLSDIKSLKMCKITGLKNLKTWYNTLEGS